MIITLSPKDILTIRFKDTDGEFKVHFDSKERPAQIIVEECAGLCGNVIGLGDTILYQENFKKIIPEFNDVMEDIKDISEAEDQQIPVNDDKYIFDRDGNIHPDYEYYDDSYDKEEGEDDSDDDDVDDDEEEDYGYESEKLEDDDVEEDKPIKRREKGKKISSKRRQNIAIVNLFGDLPPIVISGAVRIYLRKIINELDLVGESQLLSLSNNVAFIALKKMAMEE